MKALLAFCLIIVIPFISYSQNILPTFNKHVIAKDANDKITFNQTRIDYLLKKSSGKKQMASDSIALLKKQNKKLRTQIDSSIISFYGAAVLGAGTDFLSSITSTGQLNAIIQPTKNLYIGLGANLLFANPENGVKKDSVGFNSLMFPETGKFGVLASVSYKIPIAIDGINRSHYLIPQLSFAYRKVTIDSPSIGFKVLNYNVGLKYQMEYADKNENSITFSIMPYFHYFNIPDEDVFNFHKFVNDSLFTQNNVNAEIKSWGIKTTLQFNSVLFFFDIRRNMHTKNFTDSDPFKGTLVNVGFSTLFKIPLGKKNEN